MKTYILILTLILFSTFTSGAQSINIPKTITVSEGTQSLDDTERNGFSVELVGDEKDIIKSFERFLEDRDKNYDVKSFFKKISAENILVPSFSTKHFNLNAEVRQTGSSIKLWYWVSLGMDIYINSTEYPEESAKCKELLHDFAKEYFADFVQEDLDVAIETLEKSEENLDDLIDDIADLTKDEQKEQRKRLKLEEKKKKLENKLAELQIALTEKDAEIEKIDADLEVIVTKIESKETSKKEIEQKISQQQRTLQELNAMLGSIESM